MLFKLSVSNIRKSLRDYAIYFFTLIIGVSVFYVFNAVGSQAAMLEVNQSESSISELLTTVLSGISVFVAGVLGLLIVYASRFLMKRRSREFALYMVLGMSKWKISGILLLETVIIGIGSLAAGLLCGIGLSQLMSVLVVHLFEADMSAYSFTVSGAAVIKTMIYFAVMYLVVMLFNSGVITKMKLIDLMSSGRRSEQVRLKNPLLCVIVFLTAAAGLGFAYYQVCANYGQLNPRRLLIFIGIGSAATFLIFWSVSGMLLRVIMSMKGVYHSMLNSFTFRQISSKVNTMVFSMTVICLMLFVTICTLSSAFSIRNSMNDNIREYCSADIEVHVAYKDDTDVSSKDVLAFLAENGYDMRNDLGSSVHFRSYNDPALTFEVSMNDHIEEIKAAYTSLDYGTPEEIVKLSDYNALMELYGKETLTLADDEFAVVCNFPSMKTLRDMSLDEGTEMTVFGNKLRSKYGDCIDGGLSISSSRENWGKFIVPDSIADETRVDTEYVIGNYKAGADVASTDERAMSSAERILDGKMDGYGIRYGAVNTKRDISASTIGLTAIVTFIGLYIGLVFLISCGAILALKELSESVDSAGRYEILRKIGTEETEISGSLFKQTGIFFLLPLLLACVHSIFGMKFATMILQNLGTDNVAGSSAATSLIILLIYGGYFLITFMSSKNIIKERR